MLPTISLFVHEREKKVAESKELKDKELQSAKILYEEVNNRLLQAIKIKNLNEATVKVCLKLLERKWKNRTVLK